ncbi:conserved hypothetical protein [Stenotrophomonas geniculata]
MFDPQQSLLNAATLISSASVSNTASRDLAFALDDFIHAATVLGSEMVADACMTYFLL